jgi:hypothetical protein
MDFSTLTTYSIEGATALLLAVVAFKIYKLRIVSSSNCCDKHLQIKTVSRGDSNTDLELESIQNETIDRVV